MWDKSHSYTLPNTTYSCDNKDINQKGYIMDILVTIRYSTDNEDVNASVSQILENTLPYMADNVEILFDVEDN